MSMKIIMKTTTRWCYDVDDDDDDDDDDDSDNDSDDDEYDDAIGE